MATEKFIRPDKRVRFIIRERMRDHESLASMLQVTHEPLDRKAIWHRSKKWDLERIRRQRDHTARTQQELS